MRLKSSLWVKAYIRTCSFHGLNCLIVQKGDDDAGQIYIKCNHLDGSFSLFGPSFCMGEEMLLTRKFEAKTAEPGLEEKIDKLLNQQKEFDPDIWIIEVESRTSEIFLEEMI